jgi:hypothetical protein
VTVPGLLRVTVASHCVRGGVEGWAGVLPQMQGTPITHEMDERDTEREREREKQTDDRLKNKKINRYVHTYIHTTYR